MNFPIEKAKKIRLLILDVDGVLTSGRLYYGPNSLRMLDFHIQDGLGMKLLQKSGVEIAIITSRTSDAVTERMAELNIKYVFQAQHEKIIAYESLKNTLQLSDKEIACMGDDLPDLPLLRRVGLSATVANAPNIIQQQVDWISEKNSGDGAVRALCEALMQAQNTWDAMMKPFLQA